jgi:small subunit ribosomal protein S7
MRRRAAPKRYIIPDAKFGKIIITRFVNYLMTDGKKSVVEKAVYEALDIMATKLKKDPVDIFNDAIEKVTPKIEVRSRRMGGATYQIPVEVRPRRGSSLALKWLKIAVEKTSGKSLADKVSSVLFDSLNDRGWAFKKKEEVFKMAESNKAFAHYSW